MQHSQVADPFKFALLALEVKRTFLEFVNREEWAVKVKMSKDTMLWSAFIDEELNGNQGNNLIVLSSLLEAFEKQPFSLLGGLESCERTETYETESETERQLISRPCF